MSPMAPSPLAAPTSNQNPPSSSSAMRSPATPLQSLSLGLQSLPPSTSSAAAAAGSHRQMPSDHHTVGTEPVVAAHQVLESTSAAGAIARIRLSDIVPYEGAPCSAYVRAVEALSGSLTRHNAVVIELGSEEAALIRCAFESSRLYFRTRGQGGGGSWGKSSRGVHMYRAGRALEDGDSSPPCMGDVFRCLGKAARAALCAIARHLRLRSDVFNHLLDDNPLPANEASSSVLVASFSHASLQNGKGTIGGGKTTMHSEVEKGLLTLIASDNPGLQEARNNMNREPSLRSVLSDPLSGAFLEDAMVVSCGHSFGGLMLRKVLETLRCSLCNSEIDRDALIPNHALRAAALAVRVEDDRRLFHNSALRKRRKEAGEQMDALKRLNKENGEVAADGDSPRQHKGVQYPFAVNEKVLIKGNRRTPDKFVGREAVITSQCLNGWYLLKILDSGESVRLQYRSLQKISTSQSDDRLQPQLMMQNGS
ncbi:hypothetical protein MRB53_034094 [Persea americana]|uniref:Uncharacterized protein n=1 Tax=Persea americana TaxID=3435 RepID=A0ACC2KWJ2_PERAE|nr:hypothetical protein MRB53_034094 [Persea americana]